MSFVRAVAFCGLLLLLACGDGGGSHTFPTPNNGSTGTVIVAGAAQLASFLQNTTNGQLTTGAGSPVTLPALAKLCGGLSGTSLTLVALNSGAMLTFTTDSTGATRSVAQTQLGGFPNSMAIVGSFAYLWTTQTTGGLTVSRVEAYRFDTNAGTAQAAGIFLANTIVLGMVPHPNGRWLYMALNPQALQGFTIDPQTGSLGQLTNALNGVGATSDRSMAITSDGNFLLASSAGVVQVLQIDPNTGSLTQVSGSPFLVPGAAYLRAHRTNAHLVFGAGGDTLTTLQVGTNGVLTTLATLNLPQGTSPQAIDVDSTGNFLYTANANGTVSAFSINATSGVLTQVGGSPFTALQSPACLAVR